MDNALSTIVNPGALDQQIASTAQQILNETDPDKVKDLTALFNLDAKKRNVVRILKMHHLLDEVTDQVIARFEKTPDNFSNEDLIKFMQVTENSIDKATKTLEQVDQIPAIQLNQNNQVNINMGPNFDRESRQRITDKVAEVLKKLSSGEYEQDDIDIIDVQGDIDNNGID